MWRCCEIPSRIKIRIYQMRKILQTIQARDFAISGIDLHYTSCIVYFRGPNHGTALQRQAVGAGHTVKPDESIFFINYGKELARALEKGEIN